MAHCCIFKWKSLLLLKKIATALASLPQTPPVYTLDKDNTCFLGDWSEINSLQVGLVAHCSLQGARVCSQMVVLVANGFCRHTRNEVQSTNNLFIYFKKLCIYLDIVPWFLLNGTQRCFSRPTVKDRDGYDIPGLNLPRPPGGGPNTVAISKIGIGCFILFLLYMMFYSTSVCLCF